MSRTEPVDLQAWIEKQVVGDDMLWKGAFGRQMMILRDELLPVVALGAGWNWEEARSHAKVIGTHYSKSIMLPVVEYDRPDIGVRFVVRENFYNWKLSVISEKPIDVDLSGLCYTTPPIDPDYTGDPLAPCYFEGFPSDLCFGFYDASDHRKWSAEIWGHEKMWTAVFLIMKALGQVQPLRWAKRGDR